jgi:hypothetical protein
VNWQHSIEIDAPAATVWSVFSDVTRWPEWTASVDRVVPLDAPQLSPGARFQIEQPRLPKIVWEVTELDAGRAWKWRSTSAGTTTVAWHEVTSLGDGRTLARQGIDQRGFLAPLVGLLTSRLTDRYLAMEARGLKARSEQSTADDPTG